VAKLTPAPKRVRYAIPPVSAKDVAAFREAIAGHRWESVYLVALGTGLRQGEILGLTWQDVDLEAGTLTVRHSLQAGELVETKTDHSRRTLRLPLPVSTELRRQRQRQSESREAARRWDVRGFVFTTANGGPLDGVNVTHELRRLLVRAGLRPMRFHDLRHAFATLQIEAGAGLFEISRALGHKDITTTADVYAHLTDAMAQQTADRMTAILGTG
jgi:integrase